MDARERWHTLQAQLLVARRALEAGDRPAALAAVDAALEIDPDFLAAQSLRDRILKEPEAATPVAPGGGMAQFEQRARRRRVDRRVDAARAALADGRLKDAAAALEEIVELDPNLPEIRALSDELESLRRTLGASRPGHWFAAAAAFAIVVLTASWVQEAGDLVARPLVTAAVLPPGVFAGSLARADEPAPAPAADEPAPVAVSTAGSELRLADAAAAVAIDSRRNSPPVAAAAYSPGVALPGPAVPVEERVAPVRVPPPLPEPAAVLPPPAPPAAAVVSASTIPAAARRDDQVLVQQVLQRYRSAYDGLDARSARAVWPAVNEDALARAFDGLASQQLIFDACDVQVRGESADATCRGSARYVPKIGSREPRVERRTWSFTLRRTGEEWQIESAKAER